VAQKVFSEAVAAALQDEQLAMYYNAPLQPLQEDYRSDRLPSLPSWVPSLDIKDPAYAERAEMDVHTGLNLGIVCHRPSTMLNPVRFWQPTEPVLHAMCQKLPFPPVKFSADLTRLYAPGLLLGTIAEVTGDLLDSSGLLASA